MHNPRATRLVPALDVGITRKEAKTVAIDAGVRTGGQTRLQLVDVATFYGFFSWLTNGRSLGGAQIEELEINFEHSSSISAV